MKIDILHPFQAKDITGGDQDPPSCWDDTDNPRPQFPWDIPGFPLGG